MISLFLLGSPALQSPQTAVSPNQAAGTVLASPWPAARTLYGAVPPSSDNPVLSREMVAFQLNEAFQSIAAKATPTVVSITSSRANPERSRSQNSKLVSMGSGVIVSADGYILTNNHVIEEAEDIQIMLADGRTYDAAVIGTDYTTDLAVLKTKNLEPEAKLPSIRFGDSDSCRIGGWVLAIGNPLELGISVTAGIISAKSRKIDILSENPQNLQGNIDQSIESFIQTDAAINPGNSGGALINLKGELIGINTAIASRTGLYQGYGFAIPVNLARRVMEDLIVLGRVVRPVLGVLIQTLDPVTARALGMESPQGVLVEDFVPKIDSPAEQAGLERRDVIVSVGGRPIMFSHQLQETIAKYRPGDNVEVTVFRKGRLLKRLVTLGSKEISAPPVKAGQNTPAIPKTSTLGMQLRELTTDDITELNLDDNKGVFVERVSTGGLAVKAGLLPGDIIIEVNERKISSVDEVSNLLDDVSPGTAVLFMVLRGGTTRFVGLEIP